MNRLYIALLFVLVTASSAVAQPADKPAAAQKAGEIRGIITRCDALSGGTAQLGVSGVSVYIPGTSFQARPRPNGSFEIYYVPPGAYTLLVEFPSGPRVDWGGSVLTADNVITQLGTFDICRDADGDGEYEWEDCNDSNVYVNTLATEVCDGIDNNCDGGVDELPECSACSDGDQDGFYAQFGCLTVQDCDDSDNTINPVALEICDTVDNDCDGQADEGFDTTSDVNNCGACGNNCLFGADCVNGVCELLADGYACFDSLDCLSGTCVDGVCCNQPCDGLCEYCGVSQGNAGTCEYTWNNSDWRDECGGVNCSGYYLAIGNSCYSRSSPPDSLVDCDASGNCRTEEQICPTRPRGTIYKQCSSLFPLVAGTCTGTTPGVCLNEL